MSSLDKKSVWLLAASVGLGCQSIERVLELPAPAADGSHRSALVFFERQSSGTIEAAVAIDLPNLSAQRVALESADEVDVLALLYENSLAELEITPGGLTREEGAGARPIDAPHRVFRTTETSGAWTEDGAFDSSTFPWRLPPRVIGPCPELSAMAEPTLGGDPLLNLRGVVALDGARVLVAGGLATGLGGRLAFSDDLQGYAELPLPPSTQIVWGLAWDRSSTFAIATSGEGLIHKVHLQDGTITSSQSLSVGTQWLVSIGRDGTTVVYEAWPSRPLLGVKPRFVDVRDLSTEEIDTPEPLTSLAVFSASSMLGANEERVYYFDGSSWERILELDFQALYVFVGDAGHFGVLEAPDRLHVFSPERTWMQFPVTNLDMTRGVFLSDARPLIAGGSGAMQLWDRGRWCDLRPGLGRNVAALDQSPDGRFLYAVSHAAGLSRVELEE